MLLANPVRGGAIKPDRKNYPDHPSAVFRPQGSTIPLVTQDFGPSTVTQEPSMTWPGGESNIFGKAIPAGTFDNFHVGIDISRGPCGPDVLAAAPGTVRVSHADGSNAEVIVVDHGLVAGHRYETRYVHLARRLVGVGAGVVTGTVIGKLGKTGLATACHLHFAITKDGRPVDPWRRLAQNTSIDPDLPLEVPDVPIPASDGEYLAGQVAVVGNPNIGARVRVAAKDDAVVIRTIPGGQTETWLPTCWVKGDLAFDSDRWLTRWHEGQWEFTHAVNVESVTPL